MYQMYMWYVLFSSHPIIYLYYLSPTLNEIIITCIFLTGVATVNETPQVKPQRAALTEEQTDRADIIFNPIL